MLGWPYEIMILASLFCCGESSIDCMLDVCLWAANQGSLLRALGYLFTGLYFWGPGSTPTVVVAFAASQGFQRALKVTPSRDP